MGAFDALDAALGIEGDDPVAKMLMYVSFIAIAVILVVQTIMSMMYWGQQVGASLVKRANHFIYVFQTPEYELGNVPSVSLRASGSAQRWLIFLVIALYVAVFCATAYYFASLRSTEASLQFLGLIGFLVVHSAINTLVLVPGFWSASKKARHQLLMRTLFNNAVFNSVSADTAFIDALAGLGPTSALMTIESQIEGFVDAPSADSAAATAASAVTSDAAAAAYASAPAPADVAQASSQVQNASANASAAASDAFVAGEAAAASAISKGAGQAEALATLVRSSYSGIVARLDAVVRERLAPGFRKLQRALYDFVNGVSRDTVLEPLRTGSREDKWVGALIALNLYKHVSRNVPRDDPNYEAVMGVFSLDDYERRSTDYFSYLVFGTYNVIDNIAPAHRSFIPEDIQKGVLRRVHRRMTIINGLCDKASSGLVGANDVYNAYSKSMFFATLLPILFVLICYVFLKRIRSAVFECGPKENATFSDVFFDMFTPLPADFMPSMCPATATARENVKI